MLRQVSGVILCCPEKVEVLYTKESRQEMLHLRKTGFLHQIHLLPHLFSFQRSDVGRAIFV